MGMGGGGGADVSNAVNQISEMVELGLKFAEHQTGQAMRFGEQKTEQGISFMKEQTDKAMNELKTGTAVGKEEIRQGYEQYQALNAPYRIAAYNALDGLMDSMGMARLNISSADMANALENQAKLKGAQQQLTAAGTGLLRSLPNSVDPKTREMLQYAVSSGQDPSAIAKQFQYLTIPENTTALDRFKLTTANASVPRVGKDSSGLSGAGESYGGGLNPSQSSPFNSYEYMQTSPQYQPTSAVNSYLADALSAYSTLQRAQNSVNPQQSSLAAALSSGAYSQPPKVVDIF